MTTINELYVFKKILFNDLNNLNSDIYKLSLKEYKLFLNYYYDIINDPDDFQYIKFKLLNDIVITDNNIIYVVIEEYLTKFRLILEISNIVYLNETYSYDIELIDKYSSKAKTYKESKDFIKLSENNLIFEKFIGYNGINIRIIKIRKNNKQQATDSNYKVNFDLHKECDLSCVANVNNYELFDSQQISTYYFIVYYTGIFSYLKKIEFVTIYSNIASTNILPPLDDIYEAIPENKCISILFPSYSNDWRLVEINQIKLNTNISDELQICNKVVGLEGNRINIPIDKSIKENTSPYVYHVIRSIDYGITCVHYNNIYYRPSVQPYLYLSDVQRKVKEFDIQTHKQLLNYPFVHILPIDQQYKRIIKYYLIYKLDYGNLTSPINDNIRDVLNYNVTNIVMYFDHNNKDDISLLLDNITLYACFNYKNRKSDKYGRINVNNNDINYIICSILSIIINLYDYGDAANLLTTIKAINTDFTDEIINILKSKYMNSGYFDSVFNTVKITFFKNVLEINDFNYILSFPRNVVIIFFALLIFNNKCAMNIVNNT